MLWFELLILYLAAGGIVTFLLHIASAISKSHEKKHPEFTEYDKDTIPWRLFYGLVTFLFLLSVPLVLPMITFSIDIHKISQISGENDTKIFWIKKQLADRCAECRKDGYTQPFSTVECLPGEDTADGLPKAFYHPNKQEHSNHHRSHASTVILSGITIISLFCSSFLGFYCHQLYADKALLTQEQSLLQEQLDEQYRAKWAVEAELAESESAYKELSDRNLSNIGELLFWENNAVIVTTTGGSYHRYDCPHIADRPFYIYNVATANAKGYSPCLDCDPPT